MQPTCIGIGEAINQGQALVERREAGAGSFLSRARRSAVKCHCEPCDAVSAAGRSNPAPCGYRAREPYCAAGMGADAMRHRTAAQRAAVIDATEIATSPAHSRRLLAMTPWCAHHRGVRYLRARSWDGRPDLT